LIRYVSFCSIIYLKVRQGGKSHKKKLCYKKAAQTKRRAKDLDQIQDELKKPAHQPLDIDKPGMGQFYCISCA